jgi:hypothetical protein
MLFKDCLTDLWLCEYDEKDITPHGLRCRNLLSFPSNPAVKVQNSKPFGASIGRGLDIETNQNRRVKNPPINISKRMEYRQFIEYQKMNEQMRNNLIEGLRYFQFFNLNICMKYNKFLLILFIFLEIT